MAPGPDEAARSTVRNASTDVDAAGVVVTVALDPRLSLAAPAIATLVPSALTAPWSCTGTGTITCALDGPLAAGSGVDLDLPVVIALTASGPLTTTFSVAAETALVAPVSVERIVTITQPDPVFPTVPTVPVTPIAPAPVGPTVAAVPTSTPVATLPETGAATGSWLTVAMGLLLLGWFGVRISGEGRPNRDRGRP